jgi:hypothetical protein
MSNDKNSNIEFQGYVAEVYYSVTPEWSATIRRTNHYPTQKEAIAAVLENLYRICQYILDDDECDDLPEDFECDDRSADGIEEAYKERQPGVVEFVDAVKDWCEDGFTLACPYSPAFDGRITPSTAYVSKKQAAKALSQFKSPKKKNEKML